MVAGPRRLTLSLSVLALAALESIWEWNARNYDVDHAGEYLKFLQKETLKLERLYFAGVPVPTHPHLHYVFIRKRRRGHGHVAVFEVRGNRVHVINYYHTAQDWQRQLADDFPPSRP